MRMQPVAITLAIINIVLMGLVLAKMRTAKKQQQLSVPAVLRGPAFEIVDSLGRVRASITLAPPDTINGKTYPPSVLLRLVNGKGEPPIKLSAAEKGTHLSLLDEPGRGGQIITRYSHNFAKIRNRNGGEKL